MKKILTLMGAAVAALALVAAFSSCKKDNPVEPEPEQSPYPCFVYAVDHSKMMPDVLQVKLSRKSYYSDADVAFVPYDGKNLLQYGRWHDDKGHSEVDITFEKKLCAYGAIDPKASNKPYEGSPWAFGFSVGNNAKVGDTDVATVTYSFNGLHFSKTLKLTVVE